MAPPSSSDSSSDHLPEALLKTLGLAVLERVGTGDTFRLIGNPPLWWATTFKTSPESPIAVGPLAPFLQHFLDESETAWRDNHDRVVRSGPWSHRDLTSILHQFEATALTASHRALLLIERIDERFDSIQQLLQQARDQRLHHIDQVKTHERTQTSLTGSLAIATQERDDLLALLQHLDLAAIVTNQEGRVTFASPRCLAWIECPSTTVIGQPWEQSLPIDSADRKQLRQAWKAAVPQRSRHSIRFAGTTPRWIDYEIHEDPQSSERRIILLHDRTEVHHLRQQLNHQMQFHDLVGRSPAMLQIYQLVRDVARVDSTVLIEGETGTGKELIARAIHYSSPRKDRPFIAANCAGLTDSLLGSQLFGHKRGAFTGAIDDHHGLFESADGGTLFLDEIGDIPTSVQTSLLRVLQEKEITRLGETHPRKVNVRILAATHHNLNEDVIRGTFRADLLYRIRVARIHLPPLRDRRDDIPLLAQTLLGQVCAATGKAITDLHPDSLHLLMTYSWPGNVRELKSAVEFAVISARVACLMPSDFPEELRHTQRDHRPPSSQESQHAEPKAQLLKALQQAQGNRTEAAKILGISRATLYRRLLAHHIDVAE
ncbi:MAG: sigma 54-interacting transcriptional regulator [Nitrospira sp.]|nr:sigma 54-interacting transcriptional regulator [Nitrospira sp.]